MLVLLVSIIFVIGYVLISAEHKLGISKSAVAMLFAGILWALAAFGDPIRVSEDLSEAGAEIFELIVFLLSAMTLVEILAHYKFFDIVRSRIVALGLDNKRLLWV